MQVSASRRRCKVYCISRVFTSFQCIHMLYSGPLGTLNNLYGEMEATLAGNDSFPLDGSQCLFSGQEEADREHDRLFVEAFTRIEELRTGVFVSISFVAIVVLLSLTVQRSRLSWRK